MRRPVYRVAAHFVRFTGALIQALPETARYPDCWLRLRRSPCSWQHSPLVASWRLDCVDTIGVGTSMSCAAVEQKRTLGTDNPESRLDFSMSFTRTILGASTRIRSCESKQNRSNLRNTEMRQLRVQRNARGGEYSFCLLRNGALASPTPTMAQGLRRRSGNN